MFSLIISIIAIALVAVLAIATLWYGTSAYIDQRVEAGAAQIINESEQIEGAILAYNVENGHPPTICDEVNDSNCTESLQELIDAGYLKSAPSDSDHGSSWGVAVIDSGSGTEALVKTVGLLECEVANISMGFVGVTAYNGTSPTTPLVKADVSAESDQDELKYTDGNMIPQCNASLPNSVVCCATL